MERLMWVVLGGGIGAGVRFGVNEGVARMVLSGGEDGARAWPLATLIVNVVGCFLIGMLAPMAGDGRMSGEMRLFLIVGLFGGFTTFSAYGWEVMEMIREGRMGGAVGVIALNNLLGLGAVWLGWVMTARGAVAA